MKHNQNNFYRPWMFLVILGGLALTSFILPENKPPEVIIKINSITNITTTTADFSYNIRMIVSGDNKIRITESGASVTKVPSGNGSTGPAAKFAGRFFEKAATGDNYKTKLTGLLPGTKYYVNAYAVSNEGTVSSTKQVFETRSK